MIITERASTRHAPHALRDGAVVSFFSTKFDAALRMLLKLRNFATAFEVFLSLVLNEITNREEVVSS